MCRLLLLGLISVAAALGQPLAGLWDGSVTVNGLEIPFRMEFAGSGSTRFRVPYFNGDLKVTSTRGRLEQGDSVILDFDYYAARLTAQRKDGALVGTYRRAANEYPFQAKRFVAPPAAPAARSPSPDCGTWRWRAARVKRPGTSS